MKTRFLKKGYFEHEKFKNKNVQTTFKMHILLSKLYFLSKENNVIKL